MQTSIKKITPVEFELEITATAEDLAPEIMTELRTQRSKTSLKGFRKGKVPLSLVKKLYGKALAFGVAERSIQQTYESAVMKPGDHDVLGHPKITTLDYEMDGDLHAVIRFGVRPEFEIKYPKRESLSRLVHVVDDDEVDHEIEHMREAHADLVPAEGTSQNDDFVLVDLQKLDPATQTPLIGEKREDVTFYLGDERLKEAFKSALVGVEVDQQVRVRLPAEDDDDAPTVYSVTIKEIKRKDLPDIDDDFAHTVTKGSAETVDALRAEVRRRLQANWDQRSEELLESRIVDRIVELNPIDVPESVIDMYLDSFVDEIRRSREGQLPEGFDEQAYRDGRREEAVRQAKWMLVKDHIVTHEKIEIGAKDRDAFFDKSAKDGELSADLLRQYYESVSGLMDRLDQRLLTEKVIGVLREKFKLVDKDRKAFEKELEKLAKKNEKK